MTVKATDTSFEQEVLKSDTPVLVDFWAEWCGPCRMIGPSLEDIAKEMDGKLKVVKVNIDENPTAPSRYNVRSIPTLLLFKNGQVAATKIGAEPKQKLVSWINTVVSSSVSLSRARVSAVAGQHGAREVERTADQDAHRRGLGGQQVLQRRADVVCGQAIETDFGGARAGLLRRVGGMALDRHGARSCGRGAPAAAGSPRRPWSSACRRSGRAAGRPAPSPIRRPGGASTMPQSSLWPPSSHSSPAGGRASTSGPRVSFCRRAGQSTDARPFLTAASSMRNCAARRRSMQATAVAALSS